MNVADRLALGGQGGQPALDHLLLALALGDLVGLGLRAAGKVADGGQDALILDERRIVGAQAAFQLLEPMPEDAGVAARGDREAAVEVVDEERPVVESQPELAGLEHLAVGVAQDREQHLVAAARAGATPARRCRSRRRSARRGRSPGRRSTRRCRWCRPPCGWARCRGSGPGRARAARRPRRRSPPSVPISGLSEP